MESLVQDLRYALRQIRKSPGFASVVIITLALGIGATTAIVSVVNSVLLRSAKYGRPYQLMSISGKGPSTRPDEVNEVSVGDFTEWQAQASVFAGMAAYRSFEFHALNGENGEPDEVWASPVTTNLFQVLGVNAFLGRTFTSNETQAVILSHQYWRSHFASDPKILGKTIVLDGTLYWIIGIAPQDFEFPAANAQMWTPLTFSAADSTIHDHRDLSVIARLAPGTTLQQAQAMMDFIAGRLAAQNPKTNLGWTSSVVPFHSREVGDTLRHTIFALLGAVVFMLMIVCANVVSMMLARNTARQGEVAVRAALGAGRLRLIRQMVLEGMLLAFAGSVCGVLFARLALAAITSLIPKYNLIETQALKHISINLSVLGFVAALSLVIGIGVGLLPALKASRIDISEWLKEHGKNVSGGTRLQSTLVTCEVALALVLLVGAGLMVQTFRRLSASPNGFEPNHLLTVRVPLMRYKYSPAQSADFYRDVLARIRSIPGVNSAGLANNLPFTGFHLSLDVPPPPNSSASSTSSVGVAGRSVSPGYFKAMGTRFVAGRDFTEDENRMGAPCVRIVNQTLARIYWPAESAVGQQLRGICPKDAVAVIVGVVADSKQDSISSEVKPELYEPYAQHPFASFLVTFAIRTASDPLSVATAVREAVQQIDNDQPVIQLRTMQEVISESVWQEHVSASVLSILSTVALVLASVGIYGVIAYSTGRRTHELGIRSALGATPGDILRLVLRQGMYITLIGLITGIVLSLALTRTLRSLLFGVTSTDAATFAAVTLLLALTAFLACYIPARRAAMVDPLVALRYE